MEIHISSFILSFYFESFRVDIKNFYSKTTNFNPKTIDFDPKVIDFDPKINFKVVNFENQF